MVSEVAQPMTVLVTGASGFLGSHLAETLVNHGHRVRALVRKTSRTELLEELGAELVYASLEPGEGLDDAVRGVDAIVHSAGIVKARTADDFQRVNVGGTVHLLDAAESMSTPLRRFVYVSSLAAHGFPKDGRPRETDAHPTPLTHYGRSKMAGEQVVIARADRLEVSVLRPPAIYGPRVGVMFNFFKMVNMRVKAYMGDPGNRLSLIYGPDCAHALYLMLTEEHPSGSVFFVEDGREYTQREFADIVADALGVQGIGLSVPIPVIKMAALGAECWSKLTNRAVMLTRDKVLELQEPYLICSSDSIRETLGWEPEVQLEEGARRSVAWYREQGWL